MSQSSVSDAIKDKVDICAYAEHLGLHLKPHGHRGLMTTAEHDSLVLDPAKNCFYWNSRDRRGSVIDFAMEAEGLDARSAISKLRGFLDQKPYHEHLQRDGPAARQRAEQAPAPQREFKLPDKSTQGYKRLFGYLVKTRSIDKDVVQQAVNEKALYQDDRGNACFCGRDYDGEVAYATLRTTATAVQFRGDAPGSRKEVGYSHNMVGCQATKLFVTESPIDAMSLMTILKLNGKDHDQYAYLSLGGTSEVALKYHLAHQPALQKIYLCQDNDPAGILSRAACRKALGEAGFKGEVIEKPPRGKDFNEDLSRAVQDVQARQINSVQQTTINEIVMERGMTP